MDKQYPEGNRMSSFNGYGYSTAQVLIEILKRCGDDLTRENVMKQATSLKNVSPISRCPACRFRPRRPTIASTSSCR